MIEVLIALITHFAQVSIRAQQASVDEAFDVLATTSLAVSAFVHSVSLLPSLQVVVYFRQSILELRSAHWTRHLRTIIDFVLRPHFQALRVQRLAAHSAGRIALPLHVFVAYRTGGIFFKGRKVLVILLLHASHFPLLHESRLGLLTHWAILELNKPLQFGVQVRC